MILPDGIITIMTIKSTRPLKVYTARFANASSTCFFSGQCRKMAVSVEFDFKKCRFPGIKRGNGTSQSRDSHTHRFIFFWAKKVHQILNSQIPTFCSTKKSTLLFSHMEGK